MNKKLLFSFIMIYSLNCIPSSEKNKESIGSNRNEIVMHIEKNNPMAATNYRENNQENNIINDYYVEKLVLENGMTILVLETHTIPNVSLQLWYNVGSKDENNGEKGIAHLIEHMIFKGTTGKYSLNLSESDINNMTHLLSGSCNAFTTQDFTGYLFDLPTQNWKEALPVMADCMVNCAFKDEHLNSEMKAVIQELKMRRDKYSLSLVEEMLTTIFADHPYHYPIIGYKQDLWNVRGKDLMKFYKKHYYPNNATLVVVGDVHTSEVFDLANKYFGPIEPNYKYPRQLFYNNKDIASRSVTLYRDINQPLIMLCFTIPGISAKKKSAIDTLSWLLGQGKGSILHKKLVDELQLATSLTTFYWDFLFEHSLFSIVFEPKNIDSTQKIIALIHAEIEALIKNGIQEKELMRAIKKAQMEHYKILENMQSQAYDIGKMYLATGDENYIFNYLQEPKEQLQKDLLQLLTENLRPALMHTGKILPLPEHEKKSWLRLQQLSDQEDTKILSARVRTTSVEPASYAKKVEAHDVTKFNFPKPQTFSLSNGLKILYYHNSHTPKINVELRFKALGYYDPEDMQGLYNFMTSMLLEGTQRFSATQLADELESRGMSLAAYPGGASMSMLSVDLSAGLSLLHEVLTKSVFNEHEIEKVREQLFAELKNFWDTPSHFVNILIRECVYKGHPYSKNLLGTKESIAKIKRKDLIEFYKKVITPKETTIAIVGDLSGYDLPSVLEQTLGNWQGEEIKSITFPTLKQASTAHINYPINRDQVLLCFAGLSVDRKHSDFDKLFIFDQILGGGVLGSMKSRLFKLREQSGLFYGINGSLVAQADEQPGMILVKTLVSLDRLVEAEHAIKETLASVADIITEEEFIQSKNAILNTLAHYFESNASIAGSFLYLDKYGFPDTYYDTRAEALAKLTIADVQEAVRRILNANELNIFKVGRIDATALT